MHPTCAEFRSLESAFTFSILSLSRRKSKGERESREKAAVGSLRQTFRNAVTGIPSRDGGTNLQTVCYSSSRSPDPKSYRLYRTLWHVQGTDLLLPDFSLITSRRPTAERSLISIGSPTTERSLISIGSGTSTVGSEDKRWRAQPLRPPTNRRSPFHQDTCAADFVWNF